MDATEYKVITDGKPNELWASGFYGAAGKAAAEKMIEDGYWHRRMYEADRHKTLVVIPARQP